MTGDFQVPRTKAGFHGPEAVLAASHCRSSGCRDWAKCRVAWVEITVAARLKPLAQLIMVIEPVSINPPTGRLSRKPWIRLLAVVLACPALLVCALAHATFADPGAGSA